ncbi:MAG TPA: hypothetical protein VIN39_11815 [Candidatus Dormibacteraeota bacterium]
MRFPRRLVSFTLIAVAAGSVLHVAGATAAETHWLALGAQQPGESDRPTWSLAVAPGQPAVILAATQGRGVLRSADSGATWTPVIPQAEAAWVVRFDPQRAGLAYAGTQTAGLFKSVDEGRTWTAASQGLPSDVRSIEMSAGTILAGTAMGIYYSTDSAMSWHALGLSDLDIAAVAMLPRTGGFTIFAGADNGAPGSDSGTSGAGYLLKSDDLTGSWRVVKGNFPGDATVASIAVAAAPSGGTEPPVIVGTSQGLFRSDDRGTSWSPLNGLPTADFNVAVFNPANPDQIYVGSDGDQGNGGVFRSLDRGSSWSTFGTGLPARPRITALVLRPLNPPEIVAASWNPTSGQAGAYRIADPAAAVVGVAPSVSGSAAARPTPAPPVTAAVPVVTRPHVNQPASATYAVALAVLMALVLFALVRRWRMRREDRRTYSP